MKRYFGVLILFSTIFIFSFRQENNAQISVKLLSIEYFEICECSSKQPVLARVTYEVKYSGDSQLRIKNIFSDGIEIIDNVSVKDKKGNIVYDFCTVPEKKTIFKTVFLDSKGNMSEEVFVYANPVKGKIIKGTAPQTFKIQ